VLLHAKPYELRGEMLKNVLLKNEMLSGFHHEYWSGLSVKEETHVGKTLAKNALVKNALAKRVARMNYLVAQKHAETCAHSLVKMSQSSLCAESEAECYGECVGKCVVP
jgi:hypothetical protein